MKIITRKLIDMSQTVDKLYKRTYKNARQTAKVARALNQVRARYDEFEQIRKKWTDENAPESGEIKRAENPKLFNEAEKFMASLLSEEAEIETTDVITFDDIDEMCNGGGDKRSTDSAGGKGKPKDEFTAAEIDCLVTLGMLKDE